VRATSWRAVREMMAASFVGEEDERAIAMEVARKKDCTESGRKSVDSVGATPTEN